MMTVKHNTKQEIEFKWQTRRSQDEVLFIKHSKILGAKLGPAKNVLIRDVYFDTKDKYFSSRGMKCRLRCAGGRWELTQKGSRPLQNGLAVRKERTVRLKNPWGLPSAQILFRIRNHRIIRKLKLPGGAAAEANFDHCLISRGRKKVRLREIELEYLKGNLKSFKKFTRDLTLRSGLKPAECSKVATAYKTFHL